MLKHLALAGLLVLFLVLGVWHFFGPGTDGAGEDGGDHRDKQSMELAPEIANSIGMRLKLIPAGSFLMGSPKDETGFLGDEHPQHPVTLTSPFWLGRFAVTQERYHAVGL